MYTLTYGEKSAPASLSAVSTPTANEMTSITQWTTKPVGNCLHFCHPVSDNRSASWTGGGAFLDCCLPSFLSVIIFAACSRDAGKQSEDVRSAVCKPSCYCGRHQNSDRRMALTDHILCILYVCRIMKFCAGFCHPPPPKKKKIYLGFEQKSSTAACIRPLS